MRDGPLLTTREMAAFVAHGYLRFDELVPRSLAAAALAELAAGFPAAAGGAPGRPVEELWAESPAVGPILRLPRLAGIVESLVGAGARYDHHHAHVIGPRQRWSQPWHADAILDPRRTAFDVQLLFFFHDTPREMGGTMLLPGSHFRRVNESDISRTQNFRGQVAIACAAGTVVVCHHGLWHCGQPNHTDRARTMLKLRLGPTQRQVRLWDTTDAADPAVATTLATDHGWYGSEVRLEIVNRIRLWRALTADPAFDLDQWLTRLENEPS